MTITLYGIPNCDTVKGARKWLEAAGVAYDFHDYKKRGAEASLLRGWVAQVGWEALLNKRGTTFRGLGDTAKEALSEEKAIALMEQHNSIIRRPVVEYAGGLLVGFDEEEWRAALGI